MASITPLSVYFAENENKGEAYGKWVKYITQLCLAYGVVDVAQTKAMLMVHGGEEIAVLEIADYVPPALNLNQVETLAELATRIGVNFPVRATPYLSFFKLYETRQRENETIRDFTSRLQRLVRKCALTAGATVAEQQNQMVINCIVLNTVNSRLKKQMLALNVAQTLEAVMEIGDGLESVDSQLVEMSKREQTQIARITSYEKPRSASISSTNSNKPKCENCGNYHLPEEYCAGTAITCFNCETKGHFKQYCKNPKKVKPIQKSQSANNINNPTQQTSYQTTQQQYNQYSQQQAQFRNNAQNRTTQQRNNNHSTQN